MIFLTGGANKQKKHGPNLQAGVLQGGVLLLIWQAKKNEKEKQSSPKSRGAARVLT